MPYFLAVSAIKSKVGALSLLCTIEYMEVILWQKSILWQRNIL